MENKNEDSKSGALKEKILGGVFLACVAGASVVFGFSTTLASAKKKDPKFFAEGFIGSHELPESGSSLAVRALGRGTLYAVSGVGLLCFGIWKLLGVNNLQEFRSRVGSLLPRIPKHEPQGRSDFKNVRELMNYLIEESEAGKKNK